MRVQLNQKLVLVAILLAAASASIAATRADAAVKKSKHGICHERGTFGYQQTVHFETFASIEACLKSGGRLPKNSGRARPRFDPSKPARAGDDGVLYGPLVRVIDGDTIIVTIQGAELHMRLAGVDAPESDQPFGDVAGKELASLVGEQPCVMVYEEGDTYGRLIVHLWIGDTYVNAEMVRRGMAWFDSASAPNDLLVADEEEAREGKVGLWALPVEERVAPWVWRKEER
jgi:micrococcal nuclease